LEISHKLAADKNVLTQHTHTNGLETSHNFAADTNVLTYITHTRGAASWQQMNARSVNHARRCTRFQIRLKFVIMLLSARHINTHPNTWAYACTNTNARRCTGFQIRHHLVAECHTSTHTLALGRTHAQIQMHADAQDFKFVIILLLSARHINTHPSTWAYTCTNTNARRCTGFQIRHHLVAECQTHQHTP